MWIIRYVKKTVFLLIVCSILFNSPAFAQVFSGFVTDKNSIPVSGAMVEVVGHPEFTPAMSDTNGLFTLTGLTSGMTAGFKISKSGYLPVFTSESMLYSDIYVSFRNDYQLFTQAEFIELGITPGKGLISSTTYSDEDLEVGATVTATGSLHGPYQVTYGPDCTLINPDASGTYCVKNVDDGDTVTLLPSFPPLNFHSRNVTVYADSKGNSALRADITYTFYVADSSSSQLFQQGVQAMVVDHPELPVALSDAQGKVVLTLPASSGDPVEIELTKTGFMPLYTAKQNYGSNTTAQNTTPYAMATQQNFTSWGWVAGEGVIRSRTRNQDNVNIPAVVTAVGSKNGPYNVTYGSACTATSPVTSGGAVGLFCVKNLVPGDVVSVSAALPNYTFFTRTFVARADTLSQTSIKGTVTPSVSGFSPNSGKVGSVVNVTGSGFTNANVATVNEMQVAVDVIDTSNLRLSVPPGALATGIITVSTPNGTGQGPSFTVLPNDITVNLSGSGMGNVNATTGVIFACNSPLTSCGTTAVYGTSVSLSAVASVGSNFAGWSGDCSSEPCVLAMKGDQAVTANFAVQQNTLTGGSYYGTLQSALNAVSDAGVIKLKAMTLPDSGAVIFDRIGVTAILEGGYDALLVNRSARTVLNAQLFIRNGRLNISGLTVKQ